MKNKEINREYSKIHLNIEKHFKKLKQTLNYF